MRYDKRIPCKECPFRKDSIRGWLGPDTPEEVIAQVHGEGGYPCHMSTERAVKMEILYDDIQQCAGAVHHATAYFKLYRPGPLAQMQRRLEKKPYPVLGREFVQYHRKEK